MKNYLQTAKLS